MRTYIGFFQSFNLTAKRSHGFGRRAVENRWNQDMRTRAKSLYLRGRQSRWAINYDDLERVANCVGMKNFSERVADVLRPKKLAEHQVSEYTPHSFWELLSALEQPFDQNAIIRLRQIVICSDDLEISGAGSIAVKRDPTGD